MNATPLLDADARRAFTETLDENFCVSAGAGAGKTTAIVERIAQLAWQRRDEPGLLSRLAVVTYAKLSAEELRVRTRERILDRLSPSAGGRQALLGQLRGAFFGTIHSFCLRLVSEEGHFLGLPSRLNLLEDRAAQELWERFCESDALRALELPQGLLARVSRHLTFDDLLNVARVLAPAQIEPLLNAGVSDEPPELDFEAALAASGGRAKEVTSANQRRLRSWQEQFRSGAPFLPLPEFTRGSGEFREAFNGCVMPYAHWLNAAAGALAARIAQAYRDYRLEQGWMSYDDQVFWCARLLEQPKILERLRARGFIVILDEAQDTDASMFSILSEITRPPGAVLGAWPTQPAAPGPLPGRFCFVGDEQQAIYSKRADLAVYRTYVDAYRASRGGRHLEFSVTMRCPSRVIDAVNGIFPGRLEQQHAEFRKLAPRPDCPPGAAWTWELRVPDGAPSGDDGITRETRLLAGFLRERQPAGLGVANWAEVAVLAPRNDWLETAATEFAHAGLPVSLFSTKQTARAQPVQSWPAALLHVLLHPWDRFELIGVLREIFAVSDVDLARLHRRGGSGLTFWPATPVAAGGVPSAGLAQALSVLRELRAALPPTSLSRYVDLVLERTALGARLEAIGESAEGLETLRARALRAECEGMSLRDWVDHLVQSLDDSAPAAAGSGDAIQLVTCHKAKGLEWPVVLTLGMGAQLKERSTSFPLVEANPDRPRVHLTQVTMDTARKEAQSIQSREEYQRLLYVTLTRAKQLLIVPDGSELHKGGSPNFLELARWQALDLPALFSSPPGPDEMAPVDGVHPASRSQEPALFVEDPALIARAASISQAAPRRLLPSGEVHHAAPVQEVPEPVVLPASAEGGTGYGDWWHSVLQGYPWTAQPEERTRHLATAAASLALDCPWRDRGRAELERLASSAAHVQFLAQGEVFLPEMPFAYPRNAEVWIEGIMDLVIVTKDGGLWIVDWKTDRRPPSDPDEETFLHRLAAKYAPQLAPYAEVGSRGLGRPVERLLIYSTVAGALADVAGNVFVSTNSVPLGRRT